MNIVPNPYIIQDEHGISYVSGTEIRVSQIAREQTVGKKTPEEIQQTLVPLTLSQVYAALAFYYDHKALIESEMMEVTNARQTVPLTPQMLEQHLKEIEEQPKE